MKSSSHSRTERSRLRVLYFTHELPWPPRSGGQVKEANIIERLPADISLHMCALTEFYERDLSNCWMAERFCDEVSILPCVRQAAGDVRAPERVAIWSSPDIGQHLADVLARWQPDVVHVEGSFLVRHVPPTEVPLLVFEQNVEHVLQRQLDALDAADHPLWPMMLDIAKNAWSRAAICAALTSDDSVEIALHVPRKQVATVGVGYDHLGAPTARGGGVGAQVLFIGNLAWRPTLLTALRTLRLWRKIQAAVTDGELVIVGGGVPKEFVDAALALPSVRVVGAVEDVAPFLAVADIFLCPSSVGGGMQLKVVEALAAGVPTVATSAAARGLPAHLRDLVVEADGDAAIVDAVVELSLNGTERTDLRRRLRDARASLPTWKMSAEALAEAWISTVKD